MMRNLRRLRSQLQKQVIWAISTFCVIIHKFHRNDINLYILLIYSKGKLVLEKQFRLWGKTNPFIVKESRDIEIDGSAEISTTTLSIATSEFPITAAPIIPPRHSQHPAAPPLPPLRNSNR